jgi:Kef-type K+ transport system membrane component KefB
MMELGGMHALNVSQMMLQILVVLGACRAISSLADEVGQPHVNGDMIAGIMLGPSLLGRSMPVRSA